MNLLTEDLARQCQARLLTEKWLVAPSLRVGHQWLDTVARSGQPAVNVRIKTLRSMAVDLASPKMAQHGVTLVSPNAALLLIDTALRNLRGNKLEYLTDATLGRGINETVLASLTALMLAGLTDEELREDQFEVSKKGSDLMLLLAEYRRLLAAENLIEYADVLCLAVERLTDDRDCLGGDTLVLVPEDLELTALERRLLEALPSECHLELQVDQPASAADPAEPVEMDSERLAWLLAPAAAPSPKDDGTVHIFRAVGEVNEVRGVLRQCVAQGIAWDEVEVLHTDGETYVPLVYETLATLDQNEETPSDDLPVTFREGLPCRYSRPGRALVAWLEWIAANFPQAVLVKMLKEGLLALPNSEEQRASFTRLAGLLRGVGIGFGRDRYVVKLDEKLAVVAARLERADAADDEEDLTPAQRESLGRDLTDLRRLRKLVARLLASVPAATAAAADHVAGAKTFLERCVRSVNRFDRFAAQRLIAAAADMEYWLGQQDEVELDVRGWLRALPGETRVLGSGPRPGCLHVDNIHAGGHSGRPFTFIIGLDDSRFPGIGLQDPLLLDSEREKLSEELPLAATRLEEATDRFARLVARLRGTVSFAFSCRGVDEDRELFPSSAVLAVYRLLVAQPDADQQELLDWLPLPISFAPEDSSDCLNQSEWWHWRLTGVESVREAAELVLNEFDHLGQGRSATEARNTAEFTPYDGLVPEAGADLDPTAEDGPIMSSSRLESIAKCPRAFFFKYALDIAPPDDVAVDPDRWLDPLARGSLLHELFERFMRELVEQDHLPPRYDRDHAHLEELLARQVERYRDIYPPPSDGALRREVRDLERTANTFLREEEKFCCDNDCVPVYLEASLGMQAEGDGTPLDTPDPVQVSLPGGGQLRARGRVDRIDRIGGGHAETFGVWDYKTGSTWGYDRGEPLQQGRKIQPYLYVTMVAHRLREAAGGNPEVAYFGFFFPGLKAAGDRMQWTPEQLATGEQILERLCQVVAGGAFIATNDADRECTYCDYRPICGDVAAVAAASDLKLSEPDNDPLRPFAELRLTDGA